MWWGCCMVVVWLIRVWKYLLVVWGWKNVCCVDCFGFGIDSVVCWRVGDIGGKCCCIDLYCGWFG